MSYAATFFGALTVTSTLMLVSATANAEPQEPGRFRAALVGDSVIVTLDHAAFNQSADQSVTIVDERGDMVTAVPVTVGMNQQHFPLLRTISADARTLTVTPDLQAMRSAGVVPVASPMEEQLALDQLANDLGTDMGAGSIIGALVGAAVGVGLGVASCLVTGPVCVGIAPAAVAAFAAGGGVVGTVIGGGAALAGAGWNYIVTVQSPPGQSPYAGQDEALNSGGPGVPDSTLRVPLGLGGAGLQSGSSSSGSSSSGSSSSGLSSTP